MHVIFYFVCGGPIVLPLKTPGCYAGASLGSQRRHRRAHSTGTYMLQSATADFASQSTPSGPFGLSAAGKHASSSKAAGHSGQTHETVMPNCSNVSTTTRSHALNANSAHSNVLSAKEKPTTSTRIFATNSQSPLPSYSCPDSQASTLKRSGGLRLSGTSDLAVAVADSRCGGSLDDVSLSPRQCRLEEKTISSMQRSSSFADCLNQTGLSSIYDPMPVPHSTVVSSKHLPVTVSNRNSDHRQGQVPSSPPQRGCLISAISSLVLDLHWKVVSPSPSLLMKKRARQWLLWQQPRTSRQAASCHQRGARSTNCCVSSEEEVRALHQN